jgi:16S rRNA G1207 methylase RsmC
VWRELLLSQLPDSPASIADLGCGTGTLSVLLGEAGYAVDGLR